MDVETVALCRFCKKAFTHKRNVNQHIRKVHKVAPPLRVSIRCPECDEPCGRRAEVRKHLQKVHRIEQAFERISFSSIDTFNKWKQEQEKATHYSYVKANGMHATASGKKSYYYCHRSGYFKSKSTGKRKIKSQGTNKLGKLCPASIEITELDDGTIDGTFWKTHMGHFPDVERCQLPDDEKAMIARKLLEGVDENKIIQDLKLSMNAEIERKHVVTKEYLKNIKQCFNIKVALNEPETVEDDEQSVANWVEEMYQTDFNPVLLYKRENEIHPILNTEDFLLVLMTTFQKIMLTEFYFDRVCVNTLHGISDQGFHLVSIIAANKYEEGVPIALCITSVINQQSLQIFFNCVKEVMPDLKPAVFISEDSPIIYDAWEEIFEPCDYQFLCTWKVDQEWRNRLNSIKRKNKREEIYSSLKKILYEVDEDSFQEMMESFIVQIMEEETQEFYDYFTTYYHSRTEAWAYCFRKDAKVKSPMHIRTFQENLKQLCLHRRKPKRVDDCIIKLIDLVNDKKYYDFIKTQLYQENQDILNLLQIDPYSSNVDEKKTVQNCSELNEQTFQITKDHTCDNRCKLCVSVEGYKCTCSDYSTSKFNCRHIPFMLKCIKAGNINLVSEQSLFAQDNKGSIESIKSQASSICCKLNSMSTIDDKTQQKLKLVFNIVEQLVHPLLSKTRHSWSRKRKKPTSDETKELVTNNAINTTDNSISSDPALFNELIVVEEEEDNPSHVYYTEDYSLCS